MKFILLVCSFVFALTPYVNAETQLTWAFEEANIGSMPENWEVSETNGKNALADWEVKQDDSVAMGKKVLTIANNPNKGDMGNILIYKQDVFKNVELSAKIKADGTTQDSGGGILWRVVDEDHYYLAQWNSSTNHLRLYVYIGGKPSLLESVPLEADPDTWHQIDVVHYEESIEVLFDNESKIALEDKQLDFKGWIGLWAQGGGTPSFDDVIFYSEEDPE